MNMWIFFVHLRLHLAGLEFQNQSNSLVCFCLCILTQLSDAQPHPFKWESLDPASTTALDDVFSAFYPQSTGGHAGCITSHQDGCCTPGLCLWDHNFPANTSDQTCVQGVYVDGRIVWRDSACRDALSFVCSRILTGLHALQVRSYLLSIILYQRLQETKLRYRFFFSVWGRDRETASMSLYLVA